MKYWRNWRYHNLTFLAVGIVTALILSRTETFHLALLNLGKFGLLGVFLAGMLFVSVFTIAVGTVTLLSLAENFSPVTISIVAGFGAVLGDYVIFNFIKDNLIEEISPIYKSLGGNRLSRSLKTLFHSSYFSWLVPVVGAVVIASPLPDEIGVSLMGISKIKTYQFLLVSFLLNALGIFLVVSTVSSLQP